ncbi:hypothetical protein PROFUN_01970 [Planoprotostelium fungivorum]|uniref:Uncharacterized protein n=1 Tax=Planoprotostelium fungivorum TaxID=1890364 RepID=A0A2P6NB06_9EUKA|nr:hypothetical protein PROFUN_01970 [Planoprotostelium fungivorum]
MSNASIEDILADLDLFIVSTEIELDHITTRKQIKEESRETDDEETFSSRFAYEKATGVVMLPDDLPPLPPDSVPVAAPPPMPHLPNLTPHMNMNMNMMNPPILHDVPPPIWPPPQPRRVHPKQLQYLADVQYAGREKSKRLLRRLDVDPLEDPSQMQSSTGQQQLSQVEQQQQERDWKRRRASYRAKNVHITRRTPTQVAKDLIEAKMAILDNNVSFPS